MLSTKDLCYNTKTLGDVRMASESSSQKGKAKDPHDSQRTDHEVVIYIGDPTLDVSLEHTRSGSVYRN